MTTSKELVQAALNCEEVDRIPFFPPFQGFWALAYSNVTVMESINNPKVAAEAQFRVIDDCHIDGLETMWDWLIPAEVMGCGVKIPETGTIPTMTHIINEEGDLDKIEPPDPKVVHDFYRFKAARETTEIMADRIGKDHYLIASWPAPFTIAGELRGVEAMMMECFVEEDFIHALVDKSVEISKVFLEQINEWPVDAAVVADPTASGDLVSADDYAKFSLNATKQIVKCLKSGGKEEINHICGNTFDRIEHVYETGSIAYSVDFQVDMGEAVKKMNGRMAMIGNINPAATIFSGTPESVRKETKEILEKGGKVGFLFGSGCDIPVGSAYENVHAMSEVFMNF